MQDAMADKDDLDLLAEDRQDESILSLARFSNDAEETALDTQRKVSELQDANQDRKERKRYALLSYILAAVWLVAIVTVVVLQGVGLFHLSDSVLITFISTNTASVIGVLVVVVRYLFPRR